MPAGRSVPLLLLPAVAVAVAVAARRDRRYRVDTRHLRDRTAVVTGGGSGIGRALCRLLAERGAVVHVVDRDGAAAAAVVEDISRSCGRAEAHRLDVTDPAALDALAGRLAPGGVDLLFNNAGIGHAGPVAQTPLEDWQAVVDVNLLGVVHGVHAFLPHLLAQARRAAVVNTASLAGLVPVPGLVPYSATKWAVVGLSRGLDRELAGTGVRVHALCPGGVDTAIARTATLRGPYAEAVGELAARLARHGTSPDVVARAALDGVARGRAVIATPRYQVFPPWLLDRVAPKALGVLTALLVRRLAPGGG